ncbi:MAG: threonine synthase [Oscillospiraceae bacterium]
MKYISTRDKSVEVSAAQAIAQGISRESGLFVPRSLPIVDRTRLEKLVGMSYVDRACDILGGFLTDFTAEEVRECVQAAYGTGGFADEKVAPVKRIADGEYLLELWHGPTCAFKDMALQLLPHLLTRSVNKTMGGKEAAILVATSGDTGKAALDGFRDVPGTRIIVFYPAGGVSKIQYLQMATQEGANVEVYGVHGNFDDTQTGVKKIFTDPAFSERMEAKNMLFSSANSINWGRLAPQIVYYFSAYCDMVADGEIEMGDAINVCVPTGNFGNILAAYYAKGMGLPIRKFICASNINKVLTDFIGTGVYDRRRDFVLTSSPSMDILISSNLERLLFALLGDDDKAVADLMNRLSTDGVYEIPAEVLSKLQAEFYGGYCDEAGTAGAIKETWEKQGYLADTHTAVALSVYRQYRRETGDDTKTVIASTASPYKFAGSILEALTGEREEDEFAQLDKLSALTSTQIPAQIAELAGKQVRFAETCERDEMPGVVGKALGIR